MNEAVKKIELRVKFPLIWLGVLLVLALLLPSRIWNTMLVGLGGLFVVAYVWVRILQNGLHASRTLEGGWVAVGDQLSEQFEIKNNSPLPALWVEFLDESNVPGYQAAIVRSADAGRVDRWRETAVCYRRGQFFIGPWVMRTSDPFGLFWLTIRYEQREEIIIHPPIHTQLPIRLPVGQTSGQHRAEQRAWEATNNASSVRDYRAGDPLRWVHWPISAKRHSLYVREFDLDTSGDVWFVLDMDASQQLGQGADGTEEHMVLLGASLAVQALVDNRAVGLVTYGQLPQILPPQRGQGRRWQLLRALALSRADGQTSLSRSLLALADLAQRGGTAVILTANQNADWLPSLLALSRRGIQSSVVLLARESFGGEGDSRVMCEAVQKLGGACDIVPKGAVGIPTQTSEKQGYWEFKVTASGKAIPVRKPSDKIS